MFRSYPLLIVLCCFIACEALLDSTATKREKSAPVIRVTGPPAPPVVTPQEPDPPRQAPADPETCAGLLRSLDPGIEAPADPETDVTVTLSGGDGDEESLLNNVMEAARALYGEADCRYRRLKFRAPAPDGTSLEGDLSRGDFLLQREGTISRAELGRRMEMRRLETLDSLKAKLKEARRAGDHGYAATLVEQWLEKSAGETDVQLIRANIRLDQGRFAEAAREYEEFLTGSPLNLNAWYNLALAKRGMGRFADAAAILAQTLADYDRYGERGVTRDEMRLVRADALLSENRFEEAAGLLAEAVGSDAEAKALLGAAIARERGRFGDARGILEKLLASRPTSAPARFNLVLACIALKDKEGARAGYARLQADDPMLAEELSFLPLFSEKPPVPGDIAPEERQ